MRDEARRIAANIAKLLSCSAARFSSRDLVDRRGWRLRGIFSARSLPRVFAIGLAGGIIGADSSNNLLPRVVQCVAEWGISRVGYWGIPSVGCRHARIHLIFFVAFFEIIGCDLDWPKKMLPV
jgi:hypothetical protein